MQRRMARTLVPHWPSENPKVAATFEQVMENIDIVLTEGARLTTLINNLLDLEKIEAGKMSRDFAPVIPSELLSQAGDATASLHGSKDFHFETDAQPGLPAVRADRGKHGRACDRARVCKEG